MKKNKIYIHHLFPFLAEKEDETNHFSKFFQLEKYSQHFAEIFIFETDEI